MSPEVGDEEAEWAYKQGATASTPLTSEVAWVVAETGAADPPTVVAYSPGCCCGPAPPDYTSTGAGTSDYNDDWIQTGTYGGYPCYADEGSHVALWYTSDLGGGSEEETGWHDPDEAVEVEGFGNMGPYWGEWNNVERVKVKDYSYATAGVATTYVSHWRTNALDITDFDFSIPEGATVTGIAVRIDSFNLEAIGVFWDSDLRLIVDGTSVGAVKKGENLIMLGGYDVFGGEGDLWGLSGITRSQVNSTSFGVRLWFDGTTIDSGCIDTDNVQMKVYYTGDGGGTIEGATMTFSASGDLDVNLLAQRNTEMEFEGEGTLDVNGLRQAVTTMEFEAEGELEMDVDAYGSSTNSASQWLPQ